MVNKKTYDVVIIGGGVTGTATLYVISKYTNVSNIALIEKYDELAQVNSHKDNNSQTLHFGDIETNYSFEKAKIVNEAASMTASYLEAHKKEGIFTKSHKMVLAVGKKEVDALSKRYEEFKKLFPKLKKLTKEEIIKIEPKIVEGRNSDIALLAIYSPDGYAVDFGKLAESLIVNAKKEKGKNIDIFLGKEVKSIKKTRNAYEIKTNDFHISTKTVVVASGPQSLAFAHKLGYGKEFILLPVAGSFFKSSKKVNGKVYMMQLKKLPFAAIHADPDVYNPEETRYGPTAKVLPMLERYNYKSVVNFLTLFEFRLDAIFSIIKILSDPVYLKYILKQIIYDIPFLGKYVFLRAARKIVPSLKYSEIKFARHVGGIRPQIIDTKTGEMNFGEAKILGENIIFDITPSPGASVCIKNGVDNTKKVLEFLGTEFVFDKNKFEKEL